MQVNSRTLAFRVPGPFVGRKPWLSPSSASLAARAGSRDAYAPRLFRDVLRLRLEQIQERLQSDRYALLGPDDYKIHAHLVWPETQEANSARPEMAGRCGHDRHARLRRDQRKHRLHEIRLLCHLRGEAMLIAKARNRVEDFWRPFPVKQNERLIR